MIRLILEILVIFIFIIYSIIDAVVIFFVALINKKTVSQINSNTVRFVFNAMIFISGIKLHIYGKENIDDSEPILIISNHRGFFDIIIGYTLLKRPCGFVAKDALEKIPVVSYWMRKIGCLFLDRKDLRSGAMMVINAVKKLNDGISIWICPEGTRNKNENPLDLLEFKSGAFKIAEKTNCKILPVAFVGTEKVYEKQKPFIKNVDVYVSIGKMYRLDSLNENDRKDIGKYNQNIIKELIKEMAVV